MNPFAAPPICDICNDNRAVENKYGTAVKCHRCGCTDPDPEEGQKRTKDCNGCRWIAARRLDRLKAAPAAIRYGDLTEAERKIFDSWRAAGHHEMDCLRWIEGQRYDPSKDPEFLAVARPAFKEWKHR